jgi:hypothetical protein
MFYLGNSGKGVEAFGIPFLMDLLEIRIERRRLTANA